MELELLRELEIPLYIRKVKLSDSRRPTYYELTKKVKLPNKYAHHPERFKWKPYRFSKDVRVLLMDMKTGQRVIKNSKSVGTPRYKTINGQDIYNQNIVKENRNTMLQAIKSFFVPFVNTMEKIPLEDLPIRIEVEVHYTYLADNGMPWDLDNHFYMYQKGFQDVLTGHKDKEKRPRSKIIIPDDPTLFVSKPPSPLHIPIQNNEDRKLVFRIYKENDPRIINFPGRMQLFNKYVNGH